MGHMPAIRLGIQAKLLLGFGVVVTLLVAVGAVPLVSMQTIGNAHDRVTLDVLPQVEDAAAARTAAADMHFSQTRYIIIPGLRADFESDRSAFRADLAKLRAVTPPSLSGKLASVAATAKQFDAVDATLWAAVQAGDATQANRILAGSANDTSDRLVAALTGYQAAVRGEETSANATFASTQSSATWLTAGLLVVSALAAVALALLLARGLVRKIRAMLAAAERIADGDLTVDVEVHSNDELGEMGRAFQRMIERLRETVGRISTTATSVSSASQEMASTSEEAGKAVAEIAHAVSDVAAGAERQVRMVESARGAVEEVSQAVQESAVSAQETAAAAEHARELARQGVDAAEQVAVGMESVRSSTGAVTTVMQTLASKSEEIGGIVETITGIAGQTNLLALNAAIEAARAGEQGKGFAVVAEEVRKLAEESQNAAASIAELIAQVQQETQRAVDAVEEGARRTEEGSATVSQARAAFEQIGESVDDMNSRIAQIAGATQQIAASAEKVQNGIVEVASVAEQSSASTEQVSASTEQTSASTQQIASSAGELARTAEELAGIIGEFRLFA